MKTDKYRRLLSCCPSLLDAADKTANDMNEDLQNNIPAQVTAYVTAPVLFCYVSYILDSVKKKNINRIFFLSRDGYILKQIADIIIERKKLKIQTSYLYVSRYSLRNALYYKCETAEDFENAGLFTGYTLKSTKNFLKRAGLDDRQRAEVYEKIGFSDDENKDLSDSEYSAFCEKIKNDSALLCKIKNNSENNYHNIMKYFEQSGLFEKGKIAVVDSGWMGTVQKTLTALVNGRTDDNIIGYYFGLYRREDDNYKAFLFDVTDAYKYVPTFCNNLFECFCSAPHGMTTGYRECDGKIIPVLSGANAEMVKMAEIQTKTAVGFTKYACENENYIPICKMRDISARLLKALMYKPDKQEAEILGAFPFSDDVTEAKIQRLAGNCKGSISNILLPVRIIRKKKGKSIYPDKYIYWLYGSIVLTGCKPAWVYRLSVREWERLRLLRERKKLCR